MSRPDPLSQRSLTADDLGFSNQASDTPPKSPGHDQVQKIADDDTLDEPTKIDLIAIRRGWWNGLDFPTIDDYLAGKINTEITAAKLADPIDENYTSANHGRQYYDSEQTARHQRKHLSPEKALERWGPPQEFPEPNEETKNLPCTESQLWGLWHTILHASKRIPWTDEQQDKLVNLVQTLKSRPDPPAPSLMTIPLKTNWIWSHGTLWSTLLLLGSSARETWNNCCGCGAGWTVPEQHAWTNVNAFVARLTCTETSNFQLYAVWALGDALETKPGSQGHHHTDDITKLSLHLTVAYVWVELAGKWIYDRRSKEEGNSDIDLSLRGDELPWYAHYNANSARWTFWRRRFEQEGQNEVLPAEVREQASKAAKLISSFEALKG